ncbi:MAG: Exopolyphosphatase [Verrucomicrobiae bacterium]|nr:Exopolyphosphatase [Verrucomicrobiae bacterium]
MIAAIDAGSNALRLAIATVDENHHPHVVCNVREPVRLGADVFATGVITPVTLNRAVTAFRKFRNLMREHHVESFHAVATSALREARNRQAVIKRVRDATGIELNVIAGEEEARLVYLAVAGKLDLTGHRALLIDIGGGSVEIVLAVNGQIAATDTFRMGAVRLLRELGDRQPRQFNKLVREYVDATRKRLRRDIGRQPIDMCIATGGNLETLGDLRRRRYGKENDLIKLDELHELIQEMQAVPITERIKKFGLRPDRADVIIPAAIVLHRLLQWTGAKAALLPRVGLKDGLLVDLLARLHHERTQEFRNQVIGSALQLGNKYEFDRQHGQAVARFAMELFDATRGVHKLDDDHRLLLEVAALLHEVGNYVDVTGHHKHSYYLIAHSRLLGLTDWQRTIVANVARYHRKSTPTLEHEPYRALSPKARLIVDKLAAVLRLADALDKEHGSKVKRIEIEFRPPKLVLRLRGRGDLLLESWALTTKSELFEEVFGVKVTAVH